MRTTAGSALVLLIAGALAAPAPAATLDAPGSVAPAEQVAVTASGLTPGARYAVFLARAVLRDLREFGGSRVLTFLSRDGFAGLPCLGRLARRTAREGEPTVFSGALPTHLRCSDALPSSAAQPEPP